MTNKPTERACETPLVELLERVPADARLSYEHSPTHHQMISVGSLCHLAAVALRSSTPQEPDEDAEWLRKLSAYISSAGEFNWREIEDRLERIANRLQAKVPETGEE